MSDTNRTARHNVHKLLATLGFATTRGLLLAAMLVKVLFFSRENENRKSSARFDSSTAGFSVARHAVYKAFISCAMPK
jgi:hypothetical protein